MAHEQRIVTCTGPSDPHALHNISARPRHGALDVLCPVCSGYGQWNAQIDLASQRCIRTICAKCDGRGWIETGDDLVPSHDIALHPQGYPQWVTRLDPSDDVEPGPA